MTVAANTALVTGGAGFVGTNAAERLLVDGWRVRLLDDLSRPGVKANLDWISDTHGSDLEIITADVRDGDAVNAAVAGSDAIFHFAAQVAVTTSLEDPVRDAEVNIRGTLNLLEAARRQAQVPRLVFTSTNKVYGQLEDVALAEGARGYEPVDDAIRAAGINELAPLHFCTPYGCSKGAADQYVSDWATSYGVPTVVFRMSCIYGPHQCGTEDQGWVAHFLISALDGAEITIYGDGKQIRDVLYVDDLVDALMLAQSRARELAGQAFNIGGGPANAVSVLEVLDLIAEVRGGVRPEVGFDRWRQGDQRYYVSDHSRFSAATGWQPQVSPRYGVGLLHGWLTRGTRASAIAA